MVAAISHPETPLRIERQGVGRPELSMSHADLSPRLDELSVGRNLLMREVAPRLIPSAIAALVIIP
jgi:hypothetical protein